MDMNMRKRIDILNALACLKAMCASYETCGQCPAYRGVCQIKYIDPCDYELNSTSDSVWRCFQND